MVRIRHQRALQRVRVRLAHAELASCVDGLAWDGGTCLALSGGRDLITQAQSL